MTVRFIDRRLVVVSTSGDRYHYEDLYCSPLQASTIVGIQLDRLPAVGDLVELPHVAEAGGPMVSGTFRVTGRYWSYAQYGSLSWPFRSPDPCPPASLDIFVEKAPAPYADEYAGTEETPQ